MIIVLTHNGKMPSEGGIRLGYQGGNRVYMFGGDPNGYLIGSAAPASKPVEEISGPPTATLRGEYPYYHAVCPRCKLSNNVNTFDVVSVRSFDMKCRYCPQSFAVVRVFGV